MIRFLSVFYGIGLILCSSCRGPVALFEVKYSDQTAPATVELINTSKNGEVFFWDCGNGFNSEGFAPYCHYHRSGRYNVRLKAVAGPDTSVHEQELFIKASDECLIVMVTNFGNMVIRLLDETPMHREHFIKLAESGFFEGIAFHRLIPGFVIQGGDPASRKQGYSEKNDDWNPIQSEFHQKYFHTKGAVAAARLNEDVNPQKESSPTQFYIVQGRPVSEEQLSIFAAQKNIYYNPEISEKYRTLGGCPQLDMEYTVFGEVVEGLQIIDEMARVATDAGDKPKEDIIIQKMIVVK